VEKARASIECLPTFAAVTIDTRDGGEQLQEQELQHLTERLSHHSEAELGVKVR